MFERIMVPVDLAHADRLQKALDCAGDLGRHYNSKVIYVGVSASTPGTVAHNPAEFADKLDAFARRQAETFGIAAESHPMTSHDPAVDLDPTLMKAVEQTGADLVVMASHIPNLTDHIWPSNGGTLAGHAKVSVMVVRS